MTTTSSTRHFDLKFLATIALALASVLVPVYLWQLDLNSKSLVVRLIASTNLQPEASVDLADVQLTIGGVPVSKPVVSTLEVSNTGSRPIPASDFDGPLELLIAPPSKLLRARVAETSPNGIPARVKVQDGAVRLEPLLLNPGDVIGISVLTSSGQPQFETRARISGVRTVPFDHPTVQSIRWPALLFLLPIAAIAFSLYVLNLINLLPPRPSHVSATAAALTALVSISFVATCGIVLAKLHEIEYSLLLNFIYTTSLACVAAPFIWPTYKAWQQRRRNAA
jgi:hypothetical protein